MEGVCFMSGFVVCMWRQVCDFCFTNSVFDGLGASLSILSAAVGRLDFIKGSGVCVCVCVCVRLVLCVKCSGYGGWYCA